MIFVITMTATTTMMFKTTLIIMTRTTTMMSMTMIMMAITLLKFVFLQFSSTNSNIIDGYLFKPRLEER